MIDRMSTSVFDSRTAERWLEERRIGQLITLNSSHNFDQGFARISAGRPLFQRPRLLSLYSLHNNDYDEFNPFIIRGTKEVSISDICNTQHTHLILTGKPLFTFSELSRFPPFS